MKMDRMIDLRDIPDGYGRLFVVGNMLFFGQADEPREKVLSNDKSIIDVLSELSSFEGCIVFEREEQIASLINILTAMYNGWGSQKMEDK